MSEAEGSKYNAFCIGGSGEYEKAGRCFRPPNAARKNKMRLRSACVGSQLHLALAPKQVSQFIGEPCGHDTQIGIAALKGPQQHNTARGRSVLLRGGNQLRLEAVNPYLERA